MRKYKFILLTIISILFLSLVPTTYALSDNDKLILSQEEAIELALKQNNEIKELKKDIEIAEEKLKEAKADFYPNINLGSVYTRSGESNNDDTYSFNLKLQQPLYQGGLLKNGYEEAKKNVEITKFELEDKKKALKEKVIEEYYDILKAKKMINLYQQTVSKNRDYLRIAQANREAGILTNTDVLQAKVSLNQSEQNLLAVDHSLKLTKLTLKNTLGLANKLDVELSEELNWKKQDIEFKKMALCQMLCKIFSIKLINHNDFLTNLDYSIKYSTSKIHYIWNTITNSFN